MVKASLVHYHFRPRKLQAMQEEDEFGRRAQSLLDARPFTGGHNALNGFDR